MYHNLSVTVDSKFVCVTQGLIVIKVRNATLTISAFKNKNADIMQRDNRTIHQISAHSERIGIELTDANSKT